MKAALLGFLGLLTSGCLAGPVDRIDASVVFVDREERVVAQALVRGEITVAFPLLRGALFGDPDSDPIAVARVAPSGRLTLDLEPFRATLDWMAETLNEEDRAEGIGVSPPDTRLARIGTFSFDSRSRKAIGGGGFRDESNGDGLLLAYFARPCRVTGDFVDEEGEFHHDVRIQEAGIHWIRMRQTAPGKYVLEAAAPDIRPTFLVIVTEMMAF